MTIYLFVDLSAGNNAYFVVIVNAIIMTDLLFKSYYSCSWKNKVTLPAFLERK